MGLALKRSSVCLGRIGRRYRRSHHKIKEGSEAAQQISVSLGGGRKVVSDRKRLEVSL
jgi:hypothetical protein